MNVEPISSSASLLSSNRTLLIGHRGVAARAPENTLPSFSLALDAGVDLVELDFHQTRDGVPVVIHDETLDRTTDARLHWGGSDHFVCNRSVWELAALDAGRWIPGWAQPTQLPLLREALELIQPRGMTLIERKSGDPRTLLGVLSRGRWVDRVVVQSFDWEFLKEIHALEPSLILGALGPPDLPDGGEMAEGQGTLSSHWIDALASTGAGVVVWNRWVTAEAIRCAHDRGCRVWVYTVNDPGLAARLVGLGVDGLISDDVSALRAAMG